MVLAQGRRGAMLALLCRNNADAAGAARDAGATSVVAPPFGSEIFFPRGCTRPPPAALASPLSPKASRMTCNSLPPAPPVTNGFGAIAPPFRSTSRPHCLLQPPQIEEKCGLRKSGPPEGGGEAPAPVRFTESMFQISPAMPAQASTASPWLLGALKNKRVPERVLARRRPILILTPVELRFEHCRASRRFQWR